MSQSRIRVYTHSYTQIEGCVCVRESMCLFVCMSEFECVWEE